MGLRDFSKMFRGIMSGAGEELKSSNAMVAGFVLTSATARTGNADDFDAAGTFTAKCVACHGAAAEKKFDATLADADLVQIVLKGKKAEKPPNMPGYEEKGITEGQAKALVAYMKSIKN
jgi:mono/diheme cytochrome c family protein